MVPIRIGELSQIIEQAKRPQGPGVDGNGRRGLALFGGGKRKAGRADTFRQILEPQSAAQSGRSDIGPQALQRIPDGGRGIFCNSTYVRHVS